MLEPAQRPDKPPTLFDRPFPFCVLPPPFPVPLSSEARLRRKYIASLEIGSLGRITSPDQTMPSPNTVLVALVPCSPDVSSWPGFEAPDDGELMKDGLPFKSQAIARSPDTVLVELVPCSPDVSSWPGFEAPDDGELMKDGLPFKSQAAEAKESPTPSP